MHRIAELSAISIVGFALATGCTDSGAGNEEPCTEAQQTQGFPGPVKRDFDILFVIDNSSSMQEEQESLARNFERFVTVLQSVVHGLPNVHIGVVSTDVGADVPGCTASGDNGVLRSSPGLAAPAGCEPPQDAYIKDIEVGGERVRNYTGTLTDTFSCLARLGTEGCSFEQPLEAMYRALSNNVENAGFLREDAYLLVVFMTDEDDCSAQDPAVFDIQENVLEPLTSFRCFEHGVVCDPDNDPRAAGPRQNCRPRDDAAYMHPISRYVDFLKNLKKDPRDLMVAGVIGEASPVEVLVDAEGNPTLAPSCTSPDGEATPAVRLMSFLDQFPRRFTTTAICEEDWSDALALLGASLAETLSLPCLSGDIIDKDPGTPGVQPDCQVSEMYTPYMGEREEHPMPHCDEAGGALPCWRVEENPGLCAGSYSPTHLELIVEYGETSVHRHTGIQTSCAIALGNSCRASLYPLDNL